MMVGASADSVMQWLKEKWTKFQKQKWLKQLKLAHEAIKVQCAAQVRLAEAFGKKETREYAVADENEALAARINEAVYQKCYDIAKKGTSKVERTDAFAEVKEALVASFTEEETEEYGDLIGKYFNKAQKKCCT